MNSEFDSAIYSDIIFCMDPGEWDAHPGGQNDATTMSF